MYNWNEWLKRIEGKCGFCAPIEPLIIEEGTYFRVILSLGQIVEGYMLIASRQHAPCFRDVPLAWISELEQMKAKVSEVLVQVYGRCIFYEHGQAGSCLRTLLANSISHCYHAHIHAVPVQIDIFPSISNRLPNYFRIRDHSELVALKRTGVLNEPYFYYENQNNEKFIFQVGEQVDLPSQFLRRCVADMLGVPELYDWVKHPGWDRIERARDVLIPCFQEMM